MPVTADLVYQLAGHYLDCVCEALTEAMPLDPCACPPCRCVDFEQNDVVAWDHCCDGGQLYIAWERSAPYGTFPSLPDQTQTPCQPEIVLSFVIGIIRCAPTMDDNGNAPSCERKDEAARLSLIDAWVIVNAISCCLAADSEDCGSLYLLGEQRPVGDGGCQGSEIRFQVQAVDPVCIAT